MTITWPALLLNPRARILITFSMSGGKHHSSGARTDARMLCGRYKECSSVKTPAHAVGPCKTVSPGLFCSGKLELSEGNVLTNANPTKQTGEEQETVFSWKHFQHFSIHLFFVLFSFPLFLSYHCICLLFHFLISLSFAAFWMQSNANLSKHLCKPQSEIRHMV